MPLRLGGNATAIKNTKVNVASDYTGGTDINKVVIDGNVKWEKVTASFDGLTGASPTSYDDQIVIAYEDDVTSPGSPTKTGYNFTGWSPTLPRTISADTTFTAQWEAKSFDITLDPNGGTAGSDTTIAVVYATSIDAWNANHMPSRTGYTFNGFYTATSGGTKRINADGTYAALTSTTYSSAATLYAQWTPVSFTIYLDPNGGNEASNFEIDVTYATSIEAFNANMIPTREGYTFNGYYTATSGGTQRISSTAYVALTSTTYSQSVDLYAQWSIESYTIDIRENPDTGAVPSITQNYGTAITAPSAPTRTGYTFENWYNEAACTTIYTWPATMPDYGENGATKNVYAGWTIESYTINTVENGGSTVANISGDYGSSITAPADPTRTGYNFDGWYNEPEFTTEFTWPATMPDYGASGTIKYVYAKWDLKETWVTFDPDGGTGGPDPLWWPYGWNCEDLPGWNPGNMPTRTGYSFGGYFFDQDATGSQYVGDDGLNGLNTWDQEGATATIYAYWIPNTFTIYLDPNGGTAASNNYISVTYATSIEAFNANMIPSRPGYTFNGYYTATSGGTQRITSTAYIALTSTTYSSAATLYAQWTPVSYTITLNATSNGGTNASNSGISVTYGSSIESFNTNMIPYRAGYKFNGYYTATSGGTQRISPSGYVALTSTTYTGTATLYAQFTYAVGLTPALISIGAQDDAAWRLRQNTDLNAYLGQEVRLVLKYTSGSSFTGDAQFDDFNVCGTFYDPELGLNSFQRNSDAGSTNTVYSSVSWENLTTGEVAGKFGRDSGGTTSGSTGLTSGNTGSFYYYAETSNPGAGTKTFWLRSPYVTATTGTLSFYSAQYGATCGPFEAYLEIAPPPTVPTAPNIINYGCYDAGGGGDIHITWQVTNNDPREATIYAAVGDSTPETGGMVRYNVPGGGTTTQFDQGGYALGGSVTVYAKAEVSGLLSSYDAQSVSKEICFGGF